MVSQPENLQLLRICSYDHGGYTAWGWWKSWDGPGGLKDYIRRSVDRLNRFPKLKWGFHFDGSTWEWVLANDPVFVTEFKLWVDDAYAGRISLSSGGYGQPLSCTIGEEANIRHLTYDREVYERLGYRINIYMQNEHGFFPQMPQLLKGVGIDKAILRTVWGMYGICPEINASKIRWRSPEGSWVEAIPTYVGGNRGLGKNAWDTRIIIGLEGLIDFEPFRKHYLEQGVQYPVAVRIDDFPLPYEHDGSGGFDRLCSFSDKPGYLWVTGEEAFAEIPLEDVTLDTTIDDYPIQMPWGYFGNIFWNLSRQAESALLTAERLAAINSIYNGAAWEGILDRAWKLLLTAQHHDINICGPSSGGEFGELLVDVAERFYGEALELANTVIKANLKAMLFRFIATPSDRSLIIYNPLGWKRQVVVPVRIKSDKKRLPSGFRVRKNGQPLEFQLIGTELLPGGYLNYITLAVRLDMEPLEFALVNVDFIDDQQPVSLTENVGRQATLKVNLEWGKVCFNPTSGVCLVYNTQDEPLLVPEAPNGILTAVVDDQPFTSVPDSISVRESGTLFSVVEITGRIGPLPYHTEITIYRNQPRLDFRTTVEVHGQNIGATNTPAEWAGKDEPIVQEKKLLAHFTPVCDNPPKVVQDFPFMAAETHNRNINAGSWVDVSDGKRGMVLANRGTMGYLWDGKTLSNILLYSGLYSWGEAQAFLEGSYTLEYSLLFHLGDWQTGKAHQLALEYNFPAVGLSGSPRSGEFPPADAQLLITDAKTGKSCDNLVVSALYTRQGQLYLRLYDFWGRTNTEITVSLAGRPVFLIPANLLHEEIGEANQTAEIPAFAIRTFKLIIN